MSESKLPPLGPLENEVMKVIWAKGPVIAADVRAALEDQDLKESTVRTILARLETKGYLRHEVDGRTYVYEALVSPESVAAQQVKGIVDRFCKGSLENLLVGLVDDSIVTPKKLKELADRISKAEKQQRGRRKK